MQPRPRARSGWFFLIACFIFSVSVSDYCQAALFENLAICAKSISLANSCTAYPPDQMSIHYNPAGLSNVHDGLYLSQGLLTASFALKSRFDADPDFPGWLGGIYSGQPGDPDYYDYRPEADPVNDKSGTSSGVHLYIPLMGPQDMGSVGIHDGRSALDCMPRPWVDTIAMMMTRPVTMAGRYPCSILFMPHPRSAIN